MAWGKKDMVVPKAAKYPIIEVKFIINLVRISARPNMRINTTALVNSALTYASKHLQMKYNGSLVKQTFVCPVRCFYSRR
jgi:hypothetical protein